MCNIVECCILTLYAYTVVQLPNIHTHPPLSHSLFRERFTTASDVYKRLGQFDYGQPNCTIDHIKTCFGKDEYSFKWIYIGEMKEGTDDIPHGIGICVWDNGHIYEGYLKDDQQHGRGRNITNTGKCYIGELKEGSRNGEGVEYYENGDMYEGGWKNDDKHGQGTYYTEDGDKYTGIWVNRWKGKGEINYKDGKKYTGQWDKDDHCNIKRHGLGTLYSAYGQVLNQGKWECDKYKGKE